MRVAGDDVQEFAFRRVVLASSQIGRRSSTRRLTGSPTDGLTFRGDGAVVEVTGADGQVGWFPRLCGTGLGMTPAEFEVMDFGRFPPLARIVLADGDVGYDVFARQIGMRLVNREVAANGRDRVNHPEFIDAVAAGRHRTEGLTPADNRSVVPGGAGMFLTHADRRV